MRWESQVEFTIYKINVYKTLFGNPERNRSLGNPNHIQEDDINTDSG
jgi:hypothetical protein